MMKKKNLIILFSILLIITIALVITGLILNKTDNEKQNGLANQYDVSPQDSIAYIIYKHGKPRLYLHNQEQDSLIAEYDENTILFDPTFSDDGASLAFITSNKDKEKNLVSTVHVFNVKTGEQKELFTDHSTITEVEWSRDQSTLFYLRAGTFENYSPITGKRPHEFDVYAYDLNQKNSEQITHLKQYSMNSLTVSPSGDTLYIQKDDDAKVESAEDSFEVKEKIFAIPLKAPEKLEVVTDPERDVSIYSFTITPTGKELIYQSISNSDEGGTFQYELYEYDLETQKEKQLTHLKKYVEEPVISKDGKSIYFILDENFAKRNPENHLYKMNRDGSGMEEVILPREGH